MLVGALAGCGKQNDTNKTDKLSIVTTIFPEYDWVREILGDKADKKEVEEAEDLIKDLKKALEGGDIDEIKKEKDKLQEKAMALATKVYEQAAKEREQTSNDDKEENEEKPSKKNKKDDDVKEADIEEE